MRNFWLVARHEYRRTVGQRSFILVTLAVPLGLALLIGMVIVVENMGRDDSPVGYVDHSGLLDLGRLAALPDEGDRVEIYAYASLEEGQAALEWEEIQALWVIPADYPEALNTELYYLESPPDNDVWGDFDDFVRANLVAALPGDVQQRLLEGPDPTVHDVASNRNFGEKDIVNIILPLAATFLFFFATMSSAGYMLGVVAGEKENRTMEIMVTSLTPGQLIIGKAGGLLAASLTQLAIYLLAAAVGLIIGAQFVPELQRAVVPWGYLAMMALFFLPAYALMAGIMVAVGAAVTDLQQGQQLAGLLNLLFIMPMILSPLIIMNPSHPLSIFFTFFPTTSFLTISLRWGMGTVPLWQIGLSWLILVVSALSVLWAAARVFRVGMLRYGQPLDFKAAVDAIRGT